MEPITLALIALGGLTVLGRKSGGSIRAAGDVFHGNQEEARQYIISVGDYIQHQYGAMPGLTDFLLAVSYWESRFKSNAQAGDARNSARGLTQLRADSAFRESNNLTQYRSNPDLLLNPTWNLILAADYAARAAERGEQKGFGVIDWLAVRRWWRLPSLAWDANETKSDSARVRRNFEESLGKVGVSADFMYQPVHRGGWPGAITVLRDFGLM
jgi:hypothetical protein